MAARSRILCLHGLYQNGPVFSKKTQRLRAMLGGSVEFVYIDGPHSVTPKILLRKDNEEAPLKRQRPVRHSSNDTSVVGGPGYKAWWTPARCSLSREMAGDEELRTSLAHVGNFVREHGPFQAAMGYSQGASLLSLMCTRAGALEVGWVPELAIMVSGYMSEFAPHRSMYESGLCQFPSVICPTADPDAPSQREQHGSDRQHVLRSLHIYGTADKVVLPRHSARLARWMAGYPADGFDQSGGEEEEDMGIIGKEEEPTTVNEDCIAPAVSVFQHNRGHLLPQTDEAALHLRQALDLSLQ